MGDVYESVPIFEDGRFLLRFVQKSDARNLLAVYSDKNALAFFNSDNCHGDNFYYPTLEQMKKAVDFWLESYKSKFFVRWAVIDKKSESAVGTIEIFRRESSDYFNDVCVLRLDLKSDFESAPLILEIAALIVPQAQNLFGASGIITKIPVYAVERALAFSKLGFAKSEKLLIGTADGYAFKDYWEKK